MPSLAKIVPKMPFRRIQIEGIVQGFKHRWRTKLALYLGEGNMYDGIDNLATRSNKKLISQGGTEDNQTTMHEALAVHTDSLKGDICCKCGLPSTCKTQHCTDKNSK